MNLYYGYRYYADAAYAYAAASDSAYAYAYAAPYAYVDYGRLDIEDAYRLDYKVLRECV